MNGPELEHSVAHYANAPLRQLNARMKGSWIPPHAHDLYRIIETDDRFYTLFDGTKLRRTPPRQLTVPEIAPPGSVICCHRGSTCERIYTVRRVEEYCIEGSTKERGDTRIIAHSLVLSDPAEKRRRNADDAFPRINEVVAVDGRLLMLFEANDEELFLVGLPPTADDILAELLNGK